MTEVTGQVAVTSQKEAKNGKMMYSFCVDDVWYRTGFNKITGVEKGYKVKFSFTEDKYGKHVESVQFKEGEAPPSRARGGSSSTSAGSSADFWAKKEIRDIETQKRISFNGAMNTALTMVSAAISSECIPVPKGKNIGDRFEAFKAMVEEETVRLFQIYQNVPDNYETYMAGAVEDKREDFDDEVAEEFEPEKVDELEDW